MKKLIVLIMVLCFHVAFADANNNSCLPAIVKIENKNIILPGIATEDKTSQIYFFKNVSDKSLWLDQALKNRSASAGWSSYLRPGHWSAIVINRKDIAINCAVIMPGKVDYLDCGKVIAICAPKVVLTPSKRKGSYWLVEDKPWEDFISSVEKVAQAASVKNK